MNFIRNFYDRLVVELVYKFSPLLKRLTPKCIYQKLTRGFTDVDLYNLDMNLSVIIRDRVKAFSKLNYENYCSLPSSYRHMALWKRDLRKIEFAFDKLSDTGEDWIDASKYFDKIKDSEDSMDSDKWVKIVTVRREYIQKTLELFGRNFSNLWI